MHWPSPGALALIASACTVEASSPESVWLIMRWRSIQLFPERLRRDMDLVMGLPAGAMAGVRRQKMWLVRDIEALRRKSRAELLGY